MPDSGILQDSILQSIPDVSHVPTFRCFCSFLVSISKDIQLLKLVAASRKKHDFFHGFDCHLTACTSAVCLKVWNAPDSVALGVAWHQKLKQGSTCEFYRALTQVMLTLQKAVRTNSAKVRSQEFLCDLQSSGSKFYSALRSHSDLTQFESEAILSRRFRSMHFLPCAAATLWAAPGLRVSGCLD